jgi:hypothetical protein
MGVVLFLYLAGWMRGDVRLSLVLSSMVAIAIASVVGTAKDSHNAAADAEWLAAAPDLPPFSERTNLERSQAHMAPPRKARSARRGEATADTGKASESR